MYLSIFIIYKYKLYYILNALQYLQPFYLLWTLSEGERKHLSRNTRDWLSFFTASRNFVASLPLLTESRH